MPKKKPPKFYALIRRFVYPPDKKPYITHYDFYLIKKHEGAETYLTHGRLCKDHIDLLIEFLTKKNIKIKRRKQPAPISMYKKK